MFVTLPGLPAPAAAAPGFSAYSTGYPTGIGSRHVAIADLNADGWRDVVTANSSGTVSVLLGRGDGTLQTQTEYPAAGNPAWITIADFDSDGRPDVAAANENGTLSILLSNLDGSLRFGSQLANPGWMVGDVDADGRPDLVVKQDTTISVRLGVGDGTFAPATSSWIGLRYSALRAVGDLNLDGRLDLVVVDNNGYWVLLGGGDGTFTQGYGRDPTPEQDDDYTHRITNMLVGDVSGDGDPDLIYGESVCAYRDGCGGVLHGVYGNGDGTFGPVLSLGSLSYPLAVADLDGNGKPDVVSLSGGGAIIDFQRPDGSFERRRVGVYSVATAVGDLDGDTRDDFVVVSNGSALSVVIGNGDGTFGSGFERPLSFSPAVVASGDLNGDGRVDLVASYQTDYEGANPRVSVVLGDQDGGLAQAGVFDAGEVANDLALGDLNGDQRLDLAVAGDTRWGVVTVLMGDGNGGFGARIAVPTELEPHGVAIGDFDRDGHGDLVVLGNAGMSVQQGHGDGTFGPSSMYPTRFTTVEVGDFNRDSVPDLALGNLGAQAVSVMLGDGTGGFLPRTDVAIGQTPNHLTIGDLNGDGDVDLVAVIQNSVATLLGDGHGGFVLAAQVPCGSIAGQPAIGDLNGDGAADLAFSAGDPLVKILLGALDGTFGSPALFGTGGYRPRWVGIGDRNGDGRADLTVTNGGIMEDYGNDYSTYGGVGASVSVLYQNGPPLPDSAGAPVPTFAVPAFWHPDTIVLGQTFEATFTVRNDGLTSDDGRLSVSFPSFIDPSDGQWVSATASGDPPGYAETVAGGMLADDACNAVTAAYLAAEYADSDWRGQAIESNTATFTVQPRASGPFHMYVRSTMRKAGGASCELVNGVPVVGEEGYVDQQGWPVRRLTVMVSPPPPAPDPHFVTTIAPVPEWIGLGQTFTVKVAVRNEGAASDDGRIVVGFPAFTTPADSQQVTSLSVGDSPGYREIAAGAATGDSSCLSANTPHLMVEYADANWLSLGSETDTLTLTVRPAELGTFYFDVRSTQHMAGGAPCEIANAWPAGAGATITDPLGWTVRRFAVTVVPAPPQPAFVGDVIFNPPAVVTLGGTFTLTATAINSGPGSNDGRIGVSFPNLTAASDSQWVSAGSGDDTPGYREFPAGASIQRQDCSSMTASSLTVEYSDDAWSGAEAESNPLVLTIRPQATGTFYVYVRSTMRWNEALQCTYINGVPGNGTAATDQQGWGVRRFQIQVVPPAPAPEFVAPVTGIPAAMVLGESFRFTAIVKNNGPFSDDGRITVGFPTLTQAADSVWVTSASNGDQPGYVERLPGSLIPDIQCNLLPAAYLVAEYADAAWATGETDTLAVTVQPPAAGTFYVDVRSTLRDVGDTRGDCGYVIGYPPNTTNAMIDQQGWQVARFTVVVNGPSGTPPPPTASWQQIVAPPGGPSPRAGAGAVFHPGRDAIVLYGGVDPLCRDDVWSFPLAPGGAWSAITPGGTLPQQRSMHSMVYNAFDDQLVIFGGYYSGFMNDVTLMTLTEQPWWFPNSGHGTPPSVRGGHAAIHDPVRNRMLVIGGWGGALLNDVWEYAPSGNGTWRQLAPLGTPMPGRVQHVAVYDPERDRVIVIGGDGGAFLNDVWALNLSGEPAWEHIVPTGTPPSPRREHTAIYDPEGDRIILHGGFDGARRGDLWSLSLAGTPAWTLLTSSTASPANRSGHAAIYDAPRRRMVVFGGETGPQAYSREIWALSLDAIAPVAVSLASTEVDADRVKLTWSGEGLANLRSAVFRSTSVTGEWIEIGAPTVEGDDRLVFEDRDVIPGTDYGYRLVVWQGAEETTLDPVWVTVPRRAILHLSGASPNPSPRGVMVRFSLPGDHPATLELFDLKGRRIASREVGSLGAGDHLVSLSDRPDLPAGIYLVRLTQDQRALTAKACIVK